MTNKEAEALLKRLSLHYGERVAPVGRYCQALITWAEVMKDYDERLHASASHVMAMLYKSNLAARLVYGGEKLRSRPCPEHKGHWSGCSFPTDPDDRCACMCGADVTGWLPEPEDA